MTRPFLFWPLVLLAIVILGFSLTVAVTWMRDSRTISSNYEATTITINDTTIHVRVPLTAAMQSLGLGGMSSLSPNEGMMWVYNPPQSVSFWMKGMKIPLDFIWICDGRVIGITPNIPPPDGTLDTLTLYRPPSKVDRVLEVAAGFAASHDVAIGTAVDY